MCGYGVDAAVKDGAAIVNKKSSNIFLFDNHIHISKFHMNIYYYSSIFV